VSVLQQPGCSCHHGKACCCKPPASISSMVSRQDSEGSRIAQACGCNGYNNQVVAAAMLQCSSPCRCDLHVSCCCCRWLIHGARRLQGLSAWIAHLETPTGTLALTLNSRAALLPLSLTPLLLQLAPTVILPVAVAAACTCVKVSPLLLTSASAGGARLQLQLLNSMSVARCCSM
jgi:hypothetical protein